MTTASIGAHTRPTPGRTAVVRQKLTTWRRAAGVLAGRAASRALTLRRATLTVTGFGLVDASAFQLSVGVGLLTTGVSVLVFEHLTSD